MPSLRYWVHLVAPGWNVIGAGEPALPGVAIGHNEHGAWGFTIFADDRKISTSTRPTPRTHTRYRYRGAGKRCGSSARRFRVKGAGAGAVELKFTRHGPVLYEDKAHHRAYALRAAWLEQGGAPYLASLRIDQADDWAGVPGGVRYFRTPGGEPGLGRPDGHIG